MFKKWKAQRCHANSTKDNGLPAHAVGGNICAGRRYNDCADGAFRAPPLKVALGFEDLGNVKFQQKVKQLLLHFLRRLPVIAVMSKSR